MSWTSCHWNTLPGPVFKLVHLPSLNHPRTLNTKIKTVNTILNLNQFFVNDDYQGQDLGIWDCVVGWWPETMNTFRNNDYRKTNSMLIHGFCNLTDGGRVLTTAIHQNKVRWWINDMEPIFDHHGVAALRWGPGWHDGALTACLMVLLTACLAGAFAKLVWAELFSWELSWWCLCWALAVPFFGGSNFWRRGMDWDVFLIVVLNPIMTCTALTFCLCVVAVPWLMMMMVLSPTSPPKFMTATATTDYYPSLACLVADLIRFNWGWWFSWCFEPGASCFCFARGLWWWSFMFCLACGGGFRALVPSVMLEAVHVHMVDGWDGHHPQTMPRTNHCMSFGCRIWWWLMRDDWWLCVFAASRFVLSVFGASCF